MDDADTLLRAIAATPYVSPRYALARGEVVDGRFRVEYEAGAGGMGRVYRAHDSLIGRAIALKIITNATETAIDRFASEAVLLAELGHPGVVEYVAHGRLPNEQMYLAMEWLDGADLSARIHGRSLALADVWVLARRASATLAAIHKRGVVHRDIKPTNLFLPGNDPARLKLIDFGIARSAAAMARLTMTGDLVGTPLYMSPEQINNKPIGPPTDVWALGCVLYECIAGRPPFAAVDIAAAMQRIALDEPEPLTQVRVGIPEALAELVHHMMRKNPQARPPAEQLAAAFGPELLDGIGLAERDTLAAAASANERRIRPRLLVRVDPDRVADLPAAVHAQGFAVTTRNAGTFVVERDGSDGLTDQAIRVARLALELASNVPGVALAITTSNDVDGHTRLEPDRVVVDETSARLLDGSFELVHGAITRERGERVPRMLLGRPSPFVGRKRELATLKALIDESADESLARAVVVVAPAGVGKSRLCDELLLALGDTGPTVLIGVAEAAGAGSPFVMLGSALRRWARVDTSTSLAVRREALFARVAELVGMEGAARIAGFLGELAGIPLSGTDPAFDAARANPMLLGELTRGALVDWFAALSARRPVVLVLEDLHWGDAPSVSHLDTVLRVLHDKPITLLALARPEVRLAFPRLWQERRLDELALHGLSPRAAEEFVRRALGRDIAEAAIGNIVQRAGGNAFCLEELVRDHRDDELTSTPVSVIALVQTRLAALDKTARRIIRAASVFGEVFWEHGVRALLDDTGEAFSITEWLADLERRELVTSRSSARFAGQREFHFRHALTADAAHEMLTVEDSRIGHRRAAEWLISAGESDALLLASHFERGDDTHRAIDWLLVAAERTLAMGSLAAAEIAERALALGAGGASRGALRAIQATVAGRRPAYEQAVALASEALGELVPGERRWFDVLGEAVVSSARGNDPMSHDRFLALAENTPATTGAEAARVACLSRAGFQLLFAGRFDRFDRTMAEIDETSRTLELDAYSAAQLADSRALRFASVGDIRRALELQRLTSAQFTRASAKLYAVNSDLSVSLWLARLGDTARAIDSLRDVLRRGEALGGRQALQGMTMGGGAILLLREDTVDEAIALLTSGYDANRASGNIRWLGAIAVFLTLAMLKRGDVARARALGAEAVASLGAAPAFLYCALVVESQALLACGDATTALARADEAIALLNQLGGFMHEEFWGHLALFEARMAVGDRDGARTLLTETHAKLLARVATLAGTPWHESYLTTEVPRRILAHVERFPEAL